MGRKRSKISSRGQGSVYEWDLRTLNFERCRVDLSDWGALQINGVKIGSGQSRILENGSEIAFGSLQPQAQGDSLEDYRE